MYSLFLVSMYLHLLAAMVWIGGLAFISMVLAPYAQGEPAHLTAPCCWPKDS